MQNLTNYKNNWFSFIDYDPHLGQNNLHFPPNGEFDENHNPDGDRFIIACCGRRFGKSYSAAREAEVVLTQPNKVVWIVAPSYNTSEKIFRIVYEDMVIKKKYKPSQYSSKEQILKFDWAGGTSMLCGKSAEHPSGLIGEGLDLLIIDEASKVPNLQKIWEMYLRPTLSDKKGRMIAISTPDGFGYFYKLFQQGQKEKNWYSFNSPSWENHYAFPKGTEDRDLIEARNTLSKEIYEQEYGAKFTALSGQVYSEFDRNYNVGDYRYDPRYATFMTIDFGYRMPAVLWFQVVKDEKGVENIYIIDEIIHQENIKTAELVELIQKRKYRIVQTFGDPAGYQVQSSVGKGEAEIFYSLTGYRVYGLRDKASRSIASGISHVRNFICSSDGNRRLHISKRCTGIIQDIESYRYPESREGADLKELPLKDGYHDHGCDALRYGIVNKFPIKYNKIRMV